MADKAIPDISLGGAEQNMSREELAAVTKAVATLSPEDRDLLAAVQESPFRLTTAEQFLKFDKNVDCFVLEPHVQTLEEDRGCFTSRGYLFPTDDEWQHDRPQAKQTDRKPSIRERLEQSRQECRNKNKAQAPHKGKSEPEL